LGAASESRAAGASNDIALRRARRKNSVFITRLGYLLLVSHSRIGKINFARDLQERLGILALLELYEPFKICKLLIPLVDGETDPVSGHHLESIT
jgi:hypothetical protein